jgi:hypothetical protein
MLTKLQTFTAIIILLGFGLLLGHTAICHENSSECQICKFGSSLGPIDIFPGLLSILPFISFLIFFATGIPLSAGISRGVIRAPPVLFSTSL